MKKPSQDAPDRPVKIVNQTNKLLWWFMGIMVTLIGAMATWLHSDAVASTDELRTTDKNFNTLIQNHDTRLTRIETHEVDGDRRLESMEVKLDKILEKLGGK